MTYGMCLFCGYSLPSQWHGCNIIWALPGSSKLVVAAVRGQETSILNGQHSAALRSAWTYGRNIYYPYCYHYHYHCEGMKLKLQIRGSHVAYLPTTFNSLWPSDAIWQQGSRSTLVGVMACCLTAPSHYLNQCWLIISKIQLHSSNGNFTRDTSVIND